MRRDASSGSPRQHHIPNAGAGYVPMTTGPVGLLRDLQHVSREAEDQRTLPG